MPAPRSSPSATRTGSRPRTPRFGREGDLRRSQKRQTKDFVSIAECAGPLLLDQIDLLQQNRGALVGVATGFSDMDALTGGLQKST
jgi:hypothetical protein